MKLTKQQEKVIAESADAIYQAQRVADAVRTAAMMNVAKAIGFASAKGGEETLMSIIEDSSFAKDYCYTPTCFEQKDWVKAIKLAVLDQIEEWNSEDIEAERQKALK